ncbi:MAG TPA: PrsW family glutamic-type intramembrane protease [Dehalococcoidia bacterium]
MKRTLRLLGTLAGLLVSCGGTVAALTGLDVMPEAGPDAEVAGGAAAALAGTAAAAGGWVLLGWAAPRTARVLGAVAALFVLVTAPGFAVEGIAAAVQNELPGDRWDGSALAAVSAAVFAAGWVLLGWAWPAGARFFAGLTGLLLLLAGYGLGLAAVILPFSEDPDLSPGLAALAAGLGALLCVGVGGVLSWLGIRWARGPAARRRWANAAKVGAMLVGTQLFFAGLSTLLPAVVAMVAPAERSDDYVLSSTAVTALAVLYLYLGTVLTYHAVTALMGVPSRPFRPSRWLWAGLALPVALLGGQAALATREGGLVVLPAAYSVAFLLPGLLVLLLFGRVLYRNSGGSPGLPCWRDIFVMLGWGALGATSLALLLNSLNDLWVSVLVLAATGNLDGIQTSQDFWDRLAVLPDLLEPWAFFAGVFLFVAVLVPLTEEAAKALGVAFRIRALPSPGAAFMSGVASGVGFGTVEAFLYGLGGLVFGDPVLWAVLMLARAGGSTMHALAVGTTALGLYQAAHLGRPARLVRNYLLAAGLHALWNGGLVGLGFALFGESLGTESRAGAAVSFTYVGVLSVLSFCGLLIVTRRVGRALRPAAPAPPPLSRPLPGTGG